MKWQLIPKCDVGVQDGGSVAVSRRAEVCRRRLTYFPLDRQLDLKKKKRTLARAESLDAKTHLLIDTHLKPSVKYHSLNCD